MGVVGSLKKLKVTGRTVLNSISVRGKGFFLFHNFQTGSGAHSDSYRMSIGGWGGGFFPGVQRLGREDDRSPPSTADVKNGRSCTASPPIRMAFIATTLTH